MQDVIRTIVRERMDEQSVVRSRIQVKAIVRSGMADDAIIRNEMYARALIRDERNEISVIYKPTELPLPPDTTWLFTWPADVNDGFAGYPNESIFYFNFRG